MELVEGKDGVGLGLRLRLRLRGDAGVRRLYLRCCSVSLKIFLWLVQGNGWGPVGVVGLEDWLRGNAGVRLLSLRCWRVSCVWFGQGWGQVRGQESELRGDREG